MKGKGRVLFQNVCGAGWEREQEERMEGKLWSGCRINEKVVNKINKNTSVNKSSWNCLGPLHVSGDDENSRVISGTFLRSGWKPSPAHLLPTHFFSILCHPLLSMGNQPRVLESCQLYHEKWFMLCFPVALLIYSAVSISSLSWSGCWLAETGGIYAMVL